MKRFFVCAMISCFVFANGICLAEQATYLDPVVVEAARTEVDTKELPAAVDVISSDTLDLQAGSGSLYDAVKNIAGVHADVGGGMGWSVLRVRGENANVLLNGISISPYITNFPIREMPHYFRLHVISSYFILMRYRRSNLVQIRLQEWTRFSQLHCLTC